ncbi:hypothetical protein HYZ41_02290 [archaeon]|nr:hypothetical protein [archaeon]
MKIFIKKYYFFLLLALVVLLSGCTQSNTVGGSIFLHLSTDSTTVFSGNNVRINVDMENRNPRSVTNVAVSVFDAGLMNIAGGQCVKSFPKVLPNELKTFACPMIAPGKEKLLNDRTSTEVNAKVEYTTSLSFVQLVEMMAEEEYKRKSDTGELALKPSHYSYSDDNVRVDVDFSSEMPIMIKNPKLPQYSPQNYFVYFTVKNIGNGFMDDIQYNDFTVSPVGISPVGISTGNIADCVSTKEGWSLKVQGKTFPKIACMLNLPADMKSIENYGMLVTLNYRYEVREKTNIVIIR